MHDSHELSHQECEKLLRAGVAGRIAIATPTGPHIIPVNYSVFDEAIIVRTSPYSLLGTYGRDTTIAFEVDAFDVEMQRGWSVLARGRGEFVTDAEELERIRSQWAPRPWATGSRSLSLRIPLTELSGRQLGHGWDPTENLTTHRAV